MAACSRIRNLEDPFHKRVSRRFKTCFKGEQASLDVKAERVAGEVPILTHNTVTRNNEADRVTAVGHTHRPSFSRLSH